LILDDIGPRNPGVDEHHMVSFSNCSNKTIDNAILLMCIHTTESNSLTLLNTASSKILGRENSIICMIALDRMWLEARSSNQCLATIA